MPSPSAADSLNIVMAASEAVPYAKTGGLADVVGALPPELIRLGHQVTLILPAYRSLLAARGVGKSTMQFRLPTGGKWVDVTLEEEIVPVAGGLPSLRVLAVRYDPYFDRPELYQDRHGDYPDNLERFTLFCRAVLEAVRVLSTVRSETVHLLHLHDWQTALCAVHLKVLNQERKGLEHLKTLLTLHNVGYQGLFPGARFAETGLPPALFSPSGLEFYGMLNCLKGGIVFSDAVSTVSPTYAKEILTKEFGFGLEGALAGRNEGIQGIVNGIDVTAWNPETDPYLPAHYSVADLSGKRACKRALQRELGLPVREVPIFAVIGRLTAQKGFDLLREIMPSLMAFDIQIAVLGSGEHHLEQQFLAAKEQYPDRLGIVIGFDEGLAHRIQAGADLLVMPSRYEPCGLIQLYSLRYGTVPIVRRTGGLADTVIPSGSTTVESERANGFHFVDASPDALLSAIQMSLRAYREPDVWHSLQRAGMNTDVSWTRATKRYVQLYRSVIETDEEKTKSRL
jgi:starch synthase